jgi:hypothetical protein
LDLEQKEQARAKYELAYRLTTSRQEQQLLLAKIQQCG